MLLIFMPPSKELMWLRAGIKSLTVKEKLKGIVEEPDFLFIGIFLRMQY